MCIGRKPRKFRGKFESMLCSEKPFYNNDLWLAGAPGFEPGITGSKPVALTSWLRPIALGFPGPGPAGGARGTEQKPSAN